MTAKQYFQGKRVLVMGLGLFGGGGTSAKWLLKQGADVTVTDIKTEKALAPSLEKFTRREREQICFVLGKHRKSDFQKADIVVVNPGVPRENEYLKIAKENGAKLENVASIFFEFLNNPSIGVTGTRGKSTTVSFITQLLSKKYGQIKPLGTSDVPLFQEFDDLQKNKKKPAVVELSSWQLELFPEAKRALNVAVITNIFPDHLNRYKGISDYAKAKANIFAHQTGNESLILNDENEWTRYFEKQKPKGRIYYFSRKPLSKKKEGVYLSKAGTLRLHLYGKDQKFFAVNEFEKKHGKHNVGNMLAAVLAVKLFDPNFSITKKDILTLGPVAFRQEVVYQKQGKQVVNDTAATSPEATMAALDRFTSGDKEVVLITGGTDKKLDYRPLAKKIKAHIKKQNLILLEGTGTENLIRELEKISYSKKPPEMFSTLEECVAQATALMEKKKKGMVLFSPASASFEKFTNEIHRGKEFNKLVEKSNF